MVVTSKFRIFILKDWKLNRTVPENIELGLSWEKMGFMKLFPDFDVENFPFLLISARFSIVLLNVKTGYLTPFIITKATITCDQQAFCF